MFLGFFFIRFPGDALCALYRSEWASIKNCRVNSLQRFTNNELQIGGRSSRICWICISGLVHSKMLKIAPEKLKFCFTFLFFVCFIFLAHCQQSTIFIALKRVANNFCFGSCEALRCRSGAFRARCGTCSRRKSRGWHLLKWFRAVYYLAKAAARYVCMYVVFLFPFKLATGA